MVLRKAIPRHKLRKGDVDRIVGMGSESELKVEFTFASYTERVVVTLAPGDLRLPTQNEVLHVRETRAT